MGDLLILNGRLVDPAGGIDAERDVLLRDGRVAAVEIPGGLADLARSLPEELQMDAVGMVVAPGLVDVHVHLREPGQTWKETIRTGTRAASAGGFTTVVAMPNTVPVNDTVERLRWMLDGERGACVRVLAMPAATVGSLGGELTEFEALVGAGAVGFTDDGKPVLEDGVMRAALVASGRLGVPISQHAEDTRVTGGCSMNAGELAFRLGLRGMTVEAEARIAERDIRLLEEIERTEGVRAHLHVQHVSTGRAMAAIREAKARGLHVTCEVAPHHFALTEEAVAGFDANAKMNPPLRSEADRVALVEALVDGTVDCIATDHAPHAAHEKEVEFASAANGITGLETALGLVMRVLVEDAGMPVSRVVALMSAGPAGVIGRAELGTLRVGSAGDAVVFDAGARWTFDVGESRSMSRNSPFGGAAMVGRVVATVVGGAVVYRG